MATQEERLRVIGKKVDAALKMLADLKANNPDIEDEISAIENSLSGVEAPTEEPPA